MQILEEMKAKPKTYYVLYDLDTDTCILEPVSSISHGLTDFENKVDEQVMIKASTAYEVVYYIYTKN